LTSSSKQHRRPDALGEAWEAGGVGGGARGHNLRCRNCLDYLGDQGIISVFIRVFQVNSLDGENEYRPSPVPPSHPQEHRSSRPARLVTTSQRTRPKLLRSLPFHVAVINHIKIQNAHASSIPPSSYRFSPLLLWRLRLTPRSSNSVSYYNPMMRGTHTPNIVLFHIRSHRIFLIYVSIRDLRRAFLSLLNRARGSRYMLYA
jgi:hypothetical protein